MNSSTCLYAKTSDFKDAFKKLFLIETTCLSPRCRRKWHTASRMHCTKQWPTPLEAMPTQNNATNGSFNGCGHTAFSVTMNGMLTSCSPKSSSTT